MERRQLIAFRTIARTLSFTKAADILGYAQSSITAQIKRLETALRVPLFERGPGRVRLTAFGERLLPYAERLITLTEEATVAMRADRSPAGRLTIGAEEAFKFTDVVPLEFGTVEAVKRAVANGYGVSVLPQVAVRDLVATGELAELSWRPENSVDTYALWPRARDDLTILRAFISLTERVISETNHSSVQPRRTGATVGSQ